jgi:transglutaminase-like putative cysteine protease
MARQPDTSAGRQRLLALAAVAGLAAATAFAFGRVFIGRAPTVELVAAALASVLIAGLLERRGLALALLASGVGLVFALTWIVFPQTAWYGLPTMRTLRAVGRSLEFVAQQARVQVAPTPPLPPLMLAAVTAVWTAAFSTHALAIRAGSPLLAVLPPIALVGFADSVLQDGARPVYAITFLAAALAVVFVDGLRRVRQWGPIWSSSRSRRLGRPATRGARQVAVAAVFAAVLVPGLLPGFRSEALVDFSTAGDGIRLDPFVSIQAQLEENEVVDLFQVTSPAGAAYWRLYALDQFDGTTWSSSDPDAEKGQVLGPVAQLPVAPAIPASAEPLAQRYRVLHEIADPWLPMAHAAESLTVPAEEFRYDPDLGQAVIDGGLDEGFEYSVRSRILSPDPGVLDLIAFDAPSAYGRYTAVPTSVDPRVGELARRWAGDQASPYRQVLAIQEHFRDGSFQYDQEVEPVADSDALLTFLTEERRGFCQQFATAMAVLVRELGYPARVAVGFRSGEPEGGTYTVRNRDAHAWVEVFFPGVGWLAFEPTPGRANPIDRPGTYLDPAAPEAGDPGSQVGAGQGESTLGGGNVECEPAGGGGPLPGQLQNADPNACQQTRPERGLGTDLPEGFLGGGALAEPPEEDGYSIPYRWILASLAAMALLVLLLVPVVKWSWRRMMLRRSRGPRDLVLAAYRVFDGRATDLGLGRRGGETVEEHRARLSAAVALSDGHLARLVTAAEQAAYSPHEPSADQADAALRDGRTAISDLRKDAGFVRRIVGVYRPGV